jgi:hypothetical protein
VLVYGWVGIIEEDVRKGLERWGTKNESTVSKYDIPWNIVL